MSSKTKFMQRTVTHIKVYPSQLKFSKWVKAGNIQQIDRDLNPCKAQQSKDLKRSHVKNDIIQVERYI